MVCGASVSVRLRTVRGLLMSSLLFISFFFLSFCIIICQSAILPLVAVRIACIASICTEHASFYQFLMSQSDGSSVRYKLRKPHKFRLDHSTVSLYCLGARAPATTCVLPAHACVLCALCGLCVQILNIRWLLLLLLCVKSSISAHQRRRKGMCTLHE